MLGNVEWGEFKIGELFEVKRGLSMYVSDKNSFFYVNKNKKESVRLVQQTRDNNGIVAYIDKKKLPKKFLNKIEKGGQITINPDEPLSFYQEKEFIGNSVIIIDTSNITKNACLFIVSQIQRIRKHSTWNDKFSKEQVKIAKIQLPIKNNQIDFEFMENFIAELEAKKISELEAYLSVSGLKNYELTEEEKRVLEDFENNKIEFGSFKIGDLFEIKSSKKRFDANKTKICNSGNPYVVRTSLNNGIRGYLNENIEFLNESNTISFGQDTATMFYQKNKYFTGDKIKILKSKLEYFNALNAMFFITTMSKSFSSFSWGASSFNVNIISKQTTKLPTKNSQPDYKTMEIFISAIQKLVIKDVVLYSEKKLNTTKSVVGA